jgi:hypothetical protein
MATLGTTALEGEAHGIDYTQFLTFLNRKWMAFPWLQFGNCNIKQRNFISYTANMQFS